MNTERLIVTPPPHLSDPQTVAHAMRDVIISLLPVTLTSVYFYRLNALFLIAVCVATAVISDVVIRRVMGKSPTIRDGSAVVTGLLVALCFSPTGAWSWWTAALATFIGIAVAKEMMGGLGFNHFNPALFGRASVIVLAPLFVLLNPEFSELAVRFPMPDAISTATPMALLKQGTLGTAYYRLFVANAGGALAETSALAVILGGLYLYRRGHICWRIPVSVVGTVMVLTGLLGRDPVVHALAGGLLFGGVFMATDWVTSPVTKKGKILFGTGIGVVVVIFRLFLGPVEGVAFGILIMNGFVPSIDAVTRRLRFGETPAAATPVKQPVAAAVPVKQPLTSSSK
ncbi:MAG: RnfABCDGE type electron transport complex subunit D [Bacillota bacterium]|nr:RnfABCDGE type electron transport complex subunit D [Bacillota bacterium]